VEMFFHQSAALQSNTSSPDGKIYSRNVLLCDASVVEKIKDVSEVNELRMSVHNSPSVARVETYIHINVWKIIVAMTRLL
jgi:hypothetical protein